MTLITKSEAYKMLCKCESSQELHDTVEQIYNSIADNVDCEEVEEVVHAGYTYSVTGRETNQVKQANKEFRNKL